MRLPQHCAPSSAPTTTPPTDLQAEPALATQNRDQLRKIRNTREGQPVRTRAPAKRHLTFRASDADHAWLASFDPKGEWSLSAAVPALRKQFEELRSQSTTRRQAPRAMTPEEAARLIQHETRRFVNLGDKGPSLQLKSAVERALSARNQPTGRAYINEVAREIVRLTQQPPRLVAVPG